MTKSTEGIDFENFKEMIEWKKEQAFANLLLLIEQNDTNYEKRYPLIVLAFSLAISLGLEAGIRLDPSEPEWPVIFIELPTKDGSMNQVSWHIPQHVFAWDRHTTEIKYNRIHKWIEEISNEQEGA